MLEKESIQFHFGLVWLWTRGVDYNIFTSQVQAGELSMTILYN